MNAFDGLESTAALAPSAPILLPLRSIVVRLLFCFKASASAWQAEQAGHMNASEGLKSTAALAPSAPMSFQLRLIVVRLLFCFKASASALGRDHIPRQDKSHLFLTPLPSKLNLSEPRPQHCHQSLLQA